MKLESKFFLRGFWLVMLFAGLIATAQPVVAADQPFTLMSSVNSTTPFSVTLPSTLSNGKPVKTVIIEFVTADCDASVGTTYAGSAKIAVFFGGNSFYYTLPYAPGMPFVNTVEFSSAWKTEIFADPGSTLNYGLSATQPTCTVVFSGHLVPQ
jgi:hypothetical protein